MSSKKQLSNFTYAKNCIGEICGLDLFFDSSIIGKEATASDRKGGHNAK